MASTKSKSKASPNGKAAPVTAVAKDASANAAAAARKVRGPMIAAGAAAAGLAGGVALGTRHGSKRRALFAPRRRLLGVPIGPKSGALRTVELLRDGAKQLNSATSQISGTTDDVREIREQLEKVNRQSPIEVALDALTHRRGAHKREGG